MIENSIIFKEIKSSLGELQFVLITETKTKYRDWLKSRIKYLKDNPKKQIKYGVITVKEMKNKTKMVRGIKKIIRKINDNKKLQLTNQL